MANVVEKAKMTLEEFVALPNTVAFNAVYSKRLQYFLDAHPQIKAGRQLGSGYVPIYVDYKSDDVRLLFVELGNNYSLFPAILSPVDAEANNKAGITQVLDHPYLDLSGSGVIVGIVDTGVDYTQEVLRYEGGGSKIISLWDQSITGAHSERVYYGAEYSTEQINAALETEDPFSLVPSRDDDGHGTFLASVAAGRETADYIGAAPDASLVVVKLRRANEFFVRHLFLPPERPNYFHNADVMLGIEYIADIARERNMPVVICIGLGSNDASHDGNSLFGEYISYLSQRSGCAVVVAAGNESNAKHHTQGKLFRTGSTDSIGIRVGEAASFTMNIFAAGYDKISVGMVSPSGEVLSRVPFNVDLVTSERLVFDKTDITITYYRTANSVVSLGFRNATVGIWEVVLYGDSILGGEYHAWLPISYQLSAEVEFLKPVPEATIVYPGNAIQAMTCGAYDSKKNSLYVASSWGPTRLPRIAPDFVAPGVNVAGIYPTGPGTMTGTSVAAAVTTGAAALLFEWGMLQGNLVGMDGELLRQMIIGGCRRDPEQSYPNIKWGYGTLDLYGTFWSIRDAGGTRMPRL